MDGNRDSQGISTLMADIGRRAKIAARVLANASTAQKNKALAAAAAAIRLDAEVIKAANANDMAAAKDKNLTAAMLDRLALNDARIAAMVKGLEEIAALPDPVG